VDGVAEVGVSFLRKLSESDISIGGQSRTIENLSKLFTHMRSSVILMWTPVTRKHLCILNFGKMFGKFIPAW
jgi:hypothetical protein